MRVRGAVLLLTIAAAAACGGGDSSAPSRSTIDGVWAGSNQGVTITDTLKEVSRHITGRGSISATNFFVALTVAGDYVNDSTISLTMSAPGYQDLNFSGKFIDLDSVSGQLNGSGFNGFLLTLNKN